ncbi:MAG: hypothetical protein ABIF45_17940 [Pseudomonadota bacterium]
MRCGTAQVHRALVAELRIVGSFGFEQDVKFHFSHCIQLLIKGHAIHTIDSSPRCHRSASDNFGAERVRCPRISGRVRGGGGCAEQVQVGDWHKCPSSGFQTDGICAGRITPAGFLRSTIGALGGDEKGLVRMAAANAVERWRRIAELLINERAEPRHRKLSNCFARRHF